MDECTKNRIIEYSQKYDGNLAKIMINLGKDGYHITDESKIRRCLRKENSKITNSSAGSVPKKIGRKSNMYNKHSLSEAVEFSQYHS